MRIPGVDPEQVEDPEVKRIFREQTEKFGQPLPSSRVMARRPSIFLGHWKLGESLEASGLLPMSLVALVNRRVASINECPF